MDEEIIYFEINNWFAGRDYPNEEPFKQWVKDEQFSDDAWCKENKLCVKWGYVDMSESWCVAAPRSWVEKHCPNLLSDKEFTYDLISSRDGRQTYHNNYADFLCHADEDGIYHSCICGWVLPEYCEENFGAEFTNEYFDDLEDDEEEIDETDE